MNKLPRIVAIFSIAAGALMIVVGVTSYFLVQRELSEENITVSDDADRFAGEPVEGPLTAYSEAMVIKKHALEIGGGLTYAELPQDDPNRDAVQDASFLRASLFTSVVAFGVALLVAGLGLLFILVGLALLGILQRLPDVAADEPATHVAAQPRDGLTDCVAGAGAVGEHRSRIDLWAPGLARLRRYDRGWLRGDLVGGLTVGALLITQCMAYAPIAGLPPSAAFQAVLIGIPLYALLGTSRHLAIGPDPGTATLAAAGLATVAVAGTDEYVAAGAALAVLVGLLLFIASVARFGFVSDLLARPALVGYLAGLGLTLFVSQLSKLTGVPVPSEHFLERLGDFFGNLDEAHGATTVMGVGTLVLILVLKRFVPKVPGTLVGVVLSLVVTWLFGLEDRGIVVVGKIDASVPFPSLPGLPASDWLALVGTAAGVALVGFADSILTARGVAERRRYTLDANRELSALGVANAVAGACQGMPLSSTGSGTAAMASAGGNSSLGGIVAAAFVGLGLVAFPGVLAQIPQAALAAVVAAAAISLVEVDEFQALWRISRSELTIALLTAGSVVAFDVLIGVVISVALSVAITVYRIARPHDSVLGNAAELDGWVDVESYPGAVLEPGLLVYRFDAPLFFTNSGRYRERVVTALRKQPGVERWLVLDLEGVGTIDATAVASLDGLVDDVRQEGVEVIAVARANPLALDRLRRARLLEPEGPITVFHTINSAVRAFREVAT